MPTDSLLFSPMKLRSLTFKNRIFMSPMCQYSAVHGLPGQWHLIHLGSRAVGGAGLVMVEATAVAPEGRISPSDTGLWSDHQMQAFRPVAEIIHGMGSVAGIQLAHAGRKAGTSEPWNGGRPIKETWDVIAPSAMAFDAGYVVPRAMSLGDIDRIPVEFERAATRALQAGFKVVEVHMAHGYLLHEFLSPLTNLRNDQYGGSLENRMRLPLKVAQKVREVWPASLPVFVRVSATDWVDGGWDLNQTIELTDALKAMGIDLVDVSSGGIVPNAKVPIAPSYQVPLASSIKRKVGIATTAVGMITTAPQAEDILRNGDADAVMVGREFLRNPYFPLQAAAQLGAKIAWPSQYLRAKP